MSISTVSMMNRIAATRGAAAMVTGVSVNVAITNLVMEAVNRGFDVVVPRDAVCGIPADYAEAVIDNTLALLATITTVDELATIWEREA